MPTKPSRSVAPLTALIEARRGSVLPLPHRIERLYGRLRFVTPRSRPWVYSNFVTSLDGVVSFNIKGHASGADISGFNVQDRMVMGLLRAVADAIVVGSGTLDADRRHVWSAQAIFPPLADEYRKFGEALGKRGPPVNVVVSGSGDIDLSLPLFRSVSVRTLIVTTIAGAARLARQRQAHSAAIHATRNRRGTIAAQEIIDAVCGHHSCKRILVEGGPRLLGDFYAANLLDEQFLTVSPQIAGRDVGDRRLSLVMGKTFPPQGVRWGTLVDARRGSSHLFLRYAFSAPGERDGRSARSNR